MRLYLISKQLILTIQHIKKGVVFEKTFKKTGSSYIKIYFKDFDLAPGDYVEVIGHRSGETLIYAQKGKIIDEHLTMISNFWTQILLTIT